MRTIKVGSILIVGLTAIFSFLKVIGVIKWSWWVCLSPIITALALAVLVFIWIQILFAVVDKLDQKEDYE